MIIDFKRPPAHRLGGMDAVQTICITIEDYCQDFVHLRDKFYEALMRRAQKKMAQEYLKALFGRSVVAAGPGNT